MTPYRASRNRHLRTARISRLASPDELSRIHLLEAVTNEDVGRLIEVLQRPSVKTTLASERRHRITIPVLCAAVRSREPDLLRLLLGFSDDLFSVYLDQNLITTESMDVWRRALISESGVYVLASALYHFYHDPADLELADSQLAGVLLSLIEGIVELAPGVDNVRRFVNQPIEVGRRLEDQIVHSFLIRPLDVVFNHDQLYPEASTLLVRHGADISRHIAITDRNPPITHLGLLLAPWPALSDFMEQSNLNLHSGSGAVEFKNLVVPLFNADWASSEEDNTLATFFPRWCTELDHAAANHLPLPPDVYSPDDSDDGGYRGLELRLIIVCRRICAKYNEVTKQGGPATVQPRLPQEDTLNKLDQAGELYHGEPWVRFRDDTNLGW